MTFLPILLYYKHDEKDDYTTAPSNDSGRSFWRSDVSLLSLCDEAVSKISLSDLMIDIGVDIEAGELSFADIARKFDVPLDWVDEVARQLADQYAQEASFNDFLDSFDEGENDERV